MGWDASRPVPWRRLTKEFLIYAGIMAVVMLAFFRDRGIASLLIGLAAAGPIYLALGYVLAKFGYQRKTLGELGTPRATPSRDAASSPTTSGRPRPAPTKRTSTGPQHRRKARR